MWTSTSTDQSTQHNSEVPHSSVRLANLETFAVPAYKLDATTALRVICHINSASPNLPRKHRVRMSVPPALCHVDPILSYHASSRHKYDHAMSSMAASATSAFRLLVQQLLIGVDRVLVCLVPALSTGTFAPITYIYVVDIKLIFWKIVDIWYINSKTSQIFEKIILCFKNSKKISRIHKEFHSRM